MSAPDAFLNNLLSPLPHNNGAGEPLHFDVLYDTIKEALREDDARLSQGVWQTKLKLADWPQVIHLCEEALVYRSKDLQIMGWLMEAYLVTDGFKGGRRGVQILQAFCEAWWPVLYPNAVSVHLTEDALPTSIDEEAERKDAIDISERRQNILDWIDRTLQMRLLYLPLTPPLEMANLPALNLAMWVDAVDLDKKQRRSAKPLEQKGVSLQDYRRALSLAPLKGLQALLHDCTDYLNSINDLQTQLARLDLPARAHFAATEARLIEVLNILESALSKRKDEIAAQASTAMPVEEQHSSGGSANHPESPITQRPLMDDTTTANTAVDASAAEHGTQHILRQREDAYKALAQLGEFLLEIDPHSPAPYLLQLIVSWEHESLVQILHNINAGTTEAHTLLKLLASSGTIEHKI
jgi:type VI secretion system protein ImpA